jgi:hypothetical protein
MRVRRGIIAVGATIAMFGVPFATAEAASALTPTEPVVFGVITGLHTFTLDPGQTVLPGEVLRPDTPGYFSSVPVTGVFTWHGVTTVTTGATFLPLNRAKEQTAFTVVLP